MKDTTELSHLFVALLTLSNSESTSKAYTRILFFYMYILQDCLYTRHFAELALNIIIEPGCYMVI